MDQLFDADGGGDLSPQAGKLDRRHQLLWVSVDVCVEHEATERGPEVKGQRLIHHTQEDELHVQLLGDLINGQILTVQTHPGEELQLVSAHFNAETASRALSSDHWRDFQGLAGGQLVLPIVREDVLIMSVALSGLLR